MNDIIRVFPRRTKWTPTDDLAFVGEPPLFEVPQLPVFVSVVFSWDMQKGIDLCMQWDRRTCYPARVGGPAFGKCPDEFTPGQFIKKGVTFTSRGCTKNCPWCLVSRREGKLREIDIVPGHIIQDNNLLACSRPHIEKVFEMLQQQKEPIKFSGGLDIDYLQPWHVDLLRSIKVDELWVACDTAADLKRLDKAADLLADFSIEKKRCYVLIGFGDETQDEAERRLEAVYDKGFLPFSQLFRASESKCEHPLGWKALARKWSRPAMYRGGKGAVGIK